MWPVIFSLGNFELRTITLFLITSFFMGGYVFWKRGREEHYSEMQLADGLLLSVLYGLLLGRMAFIFFNLEQIGLNVINWIDIFGFPGVNQPVLYFVAWFHLYRYAIKKKWDVFEVLDFSVLAFCLAQFFVWLGLFFDGSGFGVKTNLPVGIIFPGVFEKHHPVQLYYSIFYMAVFVYLTRVEYKYRTFSWYRHGKKTAQTGFLTSMFFIFLGLFSFTLAFISLPDTVLGNFRFDFLFSILVFLFGLFLLGLRSGRISTKFFGRRNKKLLENLKV